jgi:hypothetical protein
MIADRLQAPVRYRFRAGFHKSNAPPSSILR